MVESFGVSKSVASRLATGSDESLAASGKQLVRLGDTIMPVTSRVSVLYRSTVTVLYVQYSTLLYSTVLQFCTAVRLTEGLQLPQSLGNS